MKKYKAIREEGVSAFCDYAATEGADFAF